MAPRNTAVEEEPVRPQRFRSSNPNPSACFVCVCVLHIKPFFHSVDIQHNQRPCRFSDPIK